MKKFAITLGLVLFLGSILNMPVQAQDFEGFFNFSYSESEDKIQIEVPETGVEFLYITYLSSGVGSNDLGLDRGKITGDKIVKFVKAGNKLLLVQPNYDYRASSSNADEVRAVDDAFATSVLWGFKIEKEKDGKYFIDATDFFMQDIANVAATLKRSKEGTYKVDKTRSAFYLPGVKSFPKNSEFEVTLTFTGEPTGRLTRTVTPTAESITVRQHHSFVELPDDNYKPRKFDPRAGYFGIEYMDYATPFDQSISKRFINRHRLEKKNPEAEMSEAVDPIVYYVDRGTPEPIKSALIEGASWWNKAFEAAGFINAFQVKEMPEGADLLDVRYNVIQWVHRSTRGWSYGATVQDPRTGEIIKGHVTLGSLRIRQDFMIAQGLLSPYGKDPEALENAKEMALARIRQLSAHEVGHTLGLAHAYSSSSEGRTSVMDYPQPLVKIEKGKLDLSDAYDNKIGEWDETAINYGYREFSSAGEEKQGLEKIIDDYIADKRTFLSDRTAAGGIQPFTSQWDNGSNPGDELERMMKIRKIALDNFGENTIPEGTPYATLEDVLVPIYFFHRYQIEATAKLIGGLDYRYAIKGDGQTISSFISPKLQEQALQDLLTVIKPENLAIPEKLLEQIPPKPMGYGRSRTENIVSNTGLTFDPLNAAKILSNMVFSQITKPNRAQRLIEYHSRDEKQPGMNAVLDEVIAATWKQDQPSGYYGEIKIVVDNTFLANLMQMATNEKATTELKGIVWAKIQEIKELAENASESAKSPEQKAHFVFAVHQIERFNKEPDKFKLPEIVATPQGAPIGMD